ncbi:MAG: VCBS repeat-containing protein [Chloracidobacterium sp.]|nr:VCBS repeat-containing protein [Chloracidobacterium sp.]
MERTRSIGSISIAVFVIAMATAVASAQQLKPTEIVYSRMPTNIFTSPTGANSPTIWVVGQDGSNDRFITSGTMPRISDDGRFLLFKRFSLTSHFDPFWIYPEFFVRDLSTGQETLIIPASFDDVSGGHFFSPASNQGNHEIVYNAITCLSRINRDGTNRLRFPCADANHNDKFPAIRRGGDQLIAFSNNLITPGVGGLYTVEISSSNRQKISNTTCRDFHPAWSNDNEFIAFGTISVNCDNNFPAISTYPYWVSNLVKIKPDGSGRQTLTNYPLNQDCTQTAANCFTLGYVWTENNSKVIAAGRINGVKGIFAVNADGSGAFSQIPISPGNAPDFVGGIVQPRVEQHVVSIAGGVAASGNYTLVSTIGEPIAGITSTGGPFSFESGFWAAPFASRRSPFDFDGDGKTDVGIFRPGAAEWWYRRSSDGQVPALQFGTSTDAIAPVDYTGDGKSDVAFFRPTTGEWFILRSEDGSFYSFPFGGAGDTPVPADYDGDGKGDVAVFRSTNNTWYIQRSSDLGVSIITFGASGDLPVTADYDGDGKSDIGIFRPAGRMVVSAVV